MRAVVQASAGVECSRTAGYALNQEARIFINQNRHGKC